MILPWVRELEILVQVVEPVEKVPELPAEERQHVSVSELVQEVDEVVAHAFEELGVTTAQELERLLGHPGHQLLGVHLQQDYHMHHLAIPLI